MTGQKSDAETVIAELTQRVRDAEERFRNIIMRSADAILVLSPDGFLLFCNITSEQVFGRKCEDLIGSPFGFPAIAGEISEIDIRRSDGELLVAEMWVVDTEWEGEPAYLAVLRDITARKAAENALKQRETEFRMLAENMPDPVVRLGMDLRFLYANPAAAEAAGHDVSDMVGRKASEMGYPDGLVSFWRKALEEAYQRREARLIEFETPRGHIYETTVVPELSVEGGVTSFVVVSHDVTDRKRAQELLRKDFEREKVIAETLQVAFLADISLEISGYTIGQRYKAASAEAEVGGDFLDVFRLPDGTVGLVMGDVSGKGLKAALYTAMARNMLRAYAYETADPAEALQRLSSAFCDVMEAGMFVTLFYARLNPENGTITYANAGHEPPLVYLFAGRHATMLEVTGGAVCTPVRGEYTSRQITLAPGDAMLMYTDGIADSRCGSLFFGDAELARTLEANAAGSGVDIADAVYEAAVRFSGGLLRDDAAILVIKADETSK